MWHRTIHGAQKQPDRRREEQIQDGTEHKERYRARNRNPQDKPNQEIERERDRYGELEASEQHEQSASGRVRWRRGSDAVGAAQIRRSRNFSSAQIQVTGSRNMEIFFPSLNDRDL